MEDWRRGEVFLIGVGHSLNGQGGTGMAKRLQINDLDAKAASRLTEADITKITGGRTTLTTQSLANKWFVADSFSFGVEREMKDWG